MNKSAIFAVMFARKSISDLLIESALIVFGILLGLYFQDLADNRETDKKKHIALQRILKEISHNEEVIGNAVEVHERIAARLANVDTLSHYLSTQSPVDIRRLAGRESIMTTFPRSTSWNAANASGIISEFEFGDIELFSDCYVMQQAVIDQVTVVAEIILGGPGPDPSETTARLLMNIQELEGRERMLLMGYRGTLKKMKALSDH